MENNETKNSSKIVIALMTKKEMMNDGTETTLLTVSASALSVKFK